MTELKKPWGPQGKRGAISLTFDNFGEAAEVALGFWPEDRPIGSHFTAIEVLPRLLELLDGRQATFFIEGINAQIYPEQLRSIQRAGHEIGLHAWQHEGWNQVPCVVQEELIKRSMQAMSSLSIEPVGFRPPVGEISIDGLDLLKRMGFQYCSPVGSQRSRLQDGLAILPFQWRYVDAYQMEPMLGGFRAANGAPSDPLSCDEWNGLMHSAVDDALKKNEHVSIVFHPYQFGSSADQWNVLQDFVSEVNANDDLWVASAASVADWIRHSRPGESATSKLF